MLSAGSGSDRTASLETSTSSPEANASPKQARTPPAQRTHTSTPPGLGLQSSAFWGASASLTAGSSSVGRPSPCAGLSCSTLQPRPWRWLRDRLPSRCCRVGNHARSKALLTLPVCKFGSSVSLPLYSALDFFLLPSALRLLFKFFVFTNREMCFNQVLQHMYMYVGLKVKVIKVLHQPYNIHLQNSNVNHSLNSHHAEWTDMKGTHTQHTHFFTEWERSRKSLVKRKLLKHLVKCKLLKHSGTGLGYTI